MSKGKPGNYVFSDDGKTPLTNSRSQRLWKSYRKATGITATPHQWRHLYATVLFDAGVNAKGVQVIMGHAQFSITMDIYIPTSKISALQRQLKNLTSFQAK